MGSSYRLDQCSLACLFSFTVSSVLFCTPVSPCFTDKPFPEFIRLILIFINPFLLDKSSHEREGRTNEKDIFNFGKLWAFVLFVIWSGIGSGVSSALMTITMTSLLGSTIFLLASYSHEELNHNQVAMLARIHMKYGDYVDVSEVSLL